MKIKTADRRRLLQKLPPDLAGAVVYGPDGGQVREVATTLSKLAVADPSDPFAVAEISPESLKDDPGRIANEAATVSLMGGRRLVWVRGATDGLLEAISAAAEVPGDGYFLLVEAGALEARSKLRKWADGAARIAALPCWVDDDRALGEVISETLSAAGAGIDPDARAFAVSILGGDRMVARGEIEKLALYVGPGGRASLDDVRELIGDSAETAADDVARGVLDGEPEAADGAMRRAVENGVGAIPMLRAAIRAFIRLQAMAAARADGVPTDQVLKSARPPLHFSETARYRRTVDRLSGPMISRVLDDLVTAEIRCKSTGYPDVAVCRQALLGIAGRVRSAFRGRR